MTFVSQTYTIPAAAPASSPAAPPEVPSVRPRMDADSVQAPSDAQVLKYCKATGRGFAGCLEEPVRDLGAASHPGSWKDWRGLETNEQKHLWEKTTVVFI